MISLAPREHVVTLWRVIEPLVGEALKHSAGQFDRYDVLQCLLAGEMQLWVENDLKGMGVTQVIPYPRYKAVRVVLMAGKDGLGNWVEEMLGTIEAWAKSLGARRLEEVGRKGWAKVGHRCGWHEAATVMAKDIAYE